MRRPRAAANRPYAIVIGLDTMQGLQTARILAERGVPVIAYASSPSHHACRTNVCERILIAPTGDELLDSLEALGPTLGQKAVLIPCQDGKVLTVSRHRERLSPWYHVLLPAQETVEMLMDKTAFYRFALEHGHPIAPTRFLESRADAESAAAELTFPVILKPSYRSSVWTENTTAKGFKCENPDQLLARYDRCSAWSAELIAQKWIPGSVADLYSCNAYLDREGNVLASFVARKLRQWPPDTGQSSLGEECREEAVRDETLRLLEAVGYTGLAYVETKRDPTTGRHYIVEPNVGRPTGRSAIAEGGGVELLYTMYCDATGLPLPAARVQAFTGVKWVHLRRDLQSAFVGFRRGELSVGGWWRSFRGRKVYAVFSWRDPLPFVLDIWEAVRAALSPVERRKRSL